MIKTISIRGYKSFPVNETVRIGFDTTKRVALLYGVNGAGKSAIGQVVHRNGNGIDPIPNCTLEHTRPEAYQHLVYNDDFVESTFRNRTGMPGIFTIGKPDADALARMEKLEADLASMATRKEELETNKAQRKRESDAAHTAVLDATWSTYTEHKLGALKDCVANFGGSKQKVFDALAAIVLTEGEDAPTIEALTTRMRDVGDATATAKSKVAISLAGFDTIEKDGLWSQSIVGSGDSRLAPMFDQLGNIDWVGKGRNYLTHSEGICPFCQQGLPHDFLEHLSKLFDTTYEQHVADVEALAVGYGRRIEELRLAMAALLEGEQFASQHTDLMRSWAELDRVLSANAQAMRDKKDSPKEVALIASTDSARSAIASAISEINQRIETFNARIADRHNELARIKQWFWLRMRHEHDGAISVYRAGKAAVDEALSRILEEEREISGKATESNAELVGLRAAKSGTEKAVDAINGRLAGLGIDAFRIKKQDGEGSLYHLERSGTGVDDYRSLSEGEKTLISFFYFVELINGSAVADASVAIDRKIVVIDDPISSLSHNYVYDIASVIVHDIVSMKDEDKELKQVIVLTHSLFFHHELIKAHGKPKQLEFMRVVKHTHSDVLPMSKEELLNDYEAFWQVVRDARVGKASKVSVPNAMRCIFEQYFSFTQRQEDFKAALKKLREGDHTFTALARYLDRHSHADGINRTDFGDHDMGYYLDKFQAVFSEAGQIAHYNAMMNVEEGEVAAA